VSGVRVQSSGVRVQGAGGRGQGVGGRGEKKKNDEGKENLILLDRLLIPKPHSKILLLLKIPYPQYACDVGNSLIPGDVPHYHT